MADETPATPGGVLDLSKVEEAPLKVKLPDGNLYDMANPSQLSPIAYQRLTSRYRQAESLRAKTTATPEDVDEMLSLLIDVASLVVPDADREVVGSLPYPQMQKLVEAFFNASPARPAGEAKASTTAS